MKLTVQCVDYSLQMADHTHRHGDQKLMCCTRYQDSVVHTQAAYRLIGRVCTIGASTTASILLQAPPQQALSGWMRRMTGCRPHQSNQRPWSSLGMAAQMCSPTTCMARCVLLAWLLLSWHELDLCLQTLSGGLPLSHILSPKAQSGANRIKLFICSQAISCLQSVQKS